MTNVTVQESANNPATGIPQFILEILKLMTTALKYSPVYLKKLMRLSYLSLYIKQIPFKFKSFDL